MLALFTPLPRWGALTAPESAQPRLARVARAAACEPSCSEDNDRARGGGVRVPHAAALRVRGDGGHVRAGRFLCGARRRCCHNPSADGRQHRGEAYAPAARDECAGQHCRGHRRTQAAKKACGPSCACRLTARKSRACPRSTAAWTSSCVSASRSSRKTLPFRSWSTQFASRSRRSTYASCAHACVPTRACAFVRPHAPPHSCAHACAGRRALTYADTSPHACPLAHARCNALALRTTRLRPCPSPPPGLPRHKPDEASAARVEWEHGTRADHEYLNGVLAQFSSSLAGEESSMQLLEKGRSSQTSRPAVRAFHLCLHLCVCLCGCLCVCVWGGADVLHTQRH